MANIKIESGLQLLARLTKKHDLLEFYPKIFNNGLHGNAVVEVYGGSNSCKSFLIIDIVCHSLISMTLNESDGGVLIFSTDGNLCLRNISKTLRQKVTIEEQTNNDRIDDVKIEEIILTALSKLLILEIFDVDQFYTAIENLENILIDHSIISFIIFDTLTAFYWSEHIIKLVKMDLYIDNILKLIQKITVSFQIPIIFTRPEYFTSKVEHNYLFSGKDYKIHVKPYHEANDLELILYTVTIQNNHLSTTLNFCIKNGLITWT